MSSTFAALEKKITAHVRQFTRRLDMDLRGRDIFMTDCWVNIMPEHTAHGLHLHPLSVHQRHLLCAHAARLSGSEV